MTSHSSHREEVVEPGFEPRSYQAAQPVLLTLFYEMPQRGIHHIPMAEASTESGSRASKVGLDPNPPEVGFSLF